MRISIEEINKKIHNLRNQYRFELNKSKKVVPGKPQYVSKWPYYKNLNFLENIVSVRGSHSQNNNISQNDDDGTNEDVSIYLFIYLIIREGYWDY